MFRGKWKGRIPAAARFSAANRDQAGASCSSSPRRRRAIPSRRSRRHRGSVSPEASSPRIRMIRPPQIPKPAPDPVLRALARACRRKVSPEPGWGLPEAPRETGADRFPEGWDGRGWEPGSGPVPSPIPLPGPMLVPIPLPAFGSGSGSGPDPMPLPVPGSDICPAPGEPVVRSAPGAAVPRGTGEIPSAVPVSGSPEQETALPAGEGSPSVEPGGVRPLLFPAPRGRPSRGETRRRGKGAGAAAGATAGAPLSRFRSPSRRSVPEGSRASGSGKNSRR